MHTITNPTSRFVYPNSQINSMLTLFIWERTVICPFGANDEISNNNKPTQVTSADSTTASMATVYGRFSAKAVSPMSASVRGGMMNGPHDSSQNRSSQKGIDAEHNPTPGSGDLKCQLA
ncbi:hypothetical protein PHLCEN_2v10127 [Hermanssonia centrifuga]|uniref:Uncharacterized protein n=1 Tax=Hermanssonia centrifuga TaxID=98765 RepID=A0A2R6NP02_9APHY|nr:hypothetical protein PHLCEN_2v10127 [Hermanssonia centrifuga]